MRVSIVRCARIGPVPELGGFLPACRLRRAGPLPGLYVYTRERDRSPLIMLVASLGILLAIAALIVVVFQAAPRTLPDAFGSSPWNIAGGRIEGFNVFAIDVALTGFAGMWYLRKITSFVT